MIVNLHFKRRCSLHCYCLAVCCYLLLCQSCAYIINQGYTPITSHRIHSYLNVKSRGTGIDVTSPGKDDSTTDAKSGYIKHVPVMLEGSIDLLLTNPDGRYIDATLGYGGHAEEILKRLSPKGSLVGIDRDPEAVHHSGKRLQSYVDSNQLSPLISTFSNMSLILESHGLPLEGYAGIIADLGISTHQLECAKRGFAYNTNGPLDMRMSNPLHDPFNDRKPIDPIRSLEMSNTAYKVINKGREYDIAKIIREYGEESRAALIAKRIVENRQRNGSISTTQQLRDIVLSCLHGNHKDSIKVLSRVFQALRIYVNDEIEELHKFLQLAPYMLHKKHGRLVVISYHSLEDRIVKRAFSDLQSDSMSSPDITVFKVVTKKCVTPTEEENKANQKARSAKLRCLERCRHKPSE